MEALAEVGLSYSELSKKGFEMPVVHLQMNYLSAVMHGDQIVLESWPLPRKGLRWPWRTKFIRDGQVCVAVAEVHIVLIELLSSGRKLIRNPPDYIEEAIAKLQSGIRLDS